MSGFVQAFDPCTYRRPSPRPHCRMKPALLGVPPGASSTCICPSFCCVYYQCPTGPLHQANQTIQTSHISLHSLCPLPGAHQYHILPDAFTSLHSSEPILYWQHAQEGDLSCALQWPLGLMDCSGLDFGLEWIFTSIGTDIKFISAHLGSTYDAIKGKNSLYIITMAIPGLLLRPLVKTDFSFKIMLNRLLLSLETWICHSKTVYFTFPCSSWFKSPGVQSSGRVGRTVQKSCPTDITPSSTPVLSGARWLAWLSMFPTSMCNSLELKMEQGGQKRRKERGREEKMKGGRETYKVPINSRYDDRLLHIITEFSQQPQKRSYVITSKS